MRNVTFLEHSGFFIELDSCCLMFDYWKGDIPDVAKPYYVFASHAHHDHYNPAILELLARPYPTHLIFSDDIPAPRHACVHLMKPQMELQVENLTIKTLTSTDEGVAFVVHIEDTCIYHAGDLHWWHWEEENTAQENQDAKDAYLQQISQLKDTEIDLAFVVLDPRLDEQSTWGIEAFLHSCHAQYIFPMHIWGDYDAIERYKKQLQDKSCRDRIMSIHHAQEEFVL